MGDQYSNLVQERKTEKRKGRKPGRRHSKEAALTFEDI
jgi:hypothetical protein